MAISGTLVLEDTTISFMIVESEVTGNLIARVSVMQSDRYRGDMQVDHYTTSRADGVLKALAIALHPDGMPNAEADYPEAEAAQNEIRWIP